MHRCLPFKRLDPATPSLVQDVLRLANKYEMVQLRQRIIMHLEGDWPQSLWKWDRLEAEIRASILSWEDESAQTGLIGYPDDHLPEPASAIALARSCDVPSILPAAFYHLSRLSIYNDRHMSRRAPGSACLNPSYHDSLIEGQRTVDWRLLSTTDYMALLKGRAALAAASQELFTPITASMYSACDCNKDRQIALMEEMRDVCRRSPDILETTRWYLAREDLGENVCGMCRARMRRELRTFRHMIWAQLPEYFPLIM